MRVGPLARAFASRGYQVLAFDFAGFGDSEPGSGDDRIDTDVVAAQWLRVPVLLVVPGGGHGTSLLEFGDQAPRVLTAVRIGITGIFVDDQDRPERFYTEVLGLQVKTSAPTGRTNAG